MTKQAGRIGGGMLGSEVRDPITGELLHTNLDFYQDGNGNRTSQTFKNTKDDTALLFLDVETKKISVNFDASVNDRSLYVPNKVQTIGLNADRVEFPNYTLQNSTIQNNLGSIYLNASERIQLSGLATDDIFIDNEKITTTNSNANIDLIPNGSGTVEFLKDVDVYGNINATGNISMGGDLIFGEGPETPDKVTFGTEIKSNIVPDLQGTYNLGRPGKRWHNLYSNYLNGEITSAAELTNNAVRVAHRAGNIFYVATGGDDTNVGDHPQGPFRTIKRALEASDSSSGGPVTIHVFPGTYEEEFPLIVPALVDIKGEDLRNTIVVPTTETRYNDAFLLNGESTVENLTIKDFYSGGNFFEVTNSTLNSVTLNVGTGPYAHTYVSGGTIEISSSTYNIISATYDHIIGEIIINHDGNIAASIGSNVFVTSMTFSCNGGFREYPDNGYAFRFAPGAIITTRSPYIQNTTVITKGSVTTADDPRGFDAGDAGKGAHIDGARLETGSRNASLLFHAATFITPGVDAITLTNGVRIEWLNSFTYFANRGLYAKRNEEGHLSTDGSTLDYGAEIRSIGSANVYGNYGAVADGDDCIMYLINHNFAYIGTGKNVTNDATLVVEDQQWLELNNGRIYVTNTDERGKFKVGDDFFVNLDTGITSIDADQVALDGLSQITIGDSEEVSILNDSFVQTGNIRFAGNTIYSLLGTMNIESATTNINFNNSVEMQKDLDLIGNLTLDGQLITFGDQPTDTINLNVEIEQDFIPDVNSEYNLGSNSKVWNHIYLDDARVNDIRIFDNIITTTVSNANLDLFSNGTGHVNLEKVKFQNNTLSTDVDDLDFSLTNKLFINGDGLILPNGENNDRNEVTGSLRFSTTDTRFGGWSTARETFGGIFSDDRRTSIYAELDTDDILTINVDNVKVGEINSDSVELHGLQSDSVFINDNTITTAESNADLDVRRNGTATVYLNNQEYFRNNIWTNPEPGRLSINTTDNGYVKIGGTNGTVLGVAGLAITDNVEQQSVGTDVSGANLWENDNGVRIDQAVVTASGNGTDVIQDKQVVGSTTTGTENYFIDFGVDNIDDIIDVILTQIRFRGNFQDTNEYVDITIPGDTFPDYTVRIGEFEDSGNTTDWTVSGEFNNISLSTRTYTNTGPEASSFVTKIVQGPGGNYGLNITVDIPTSLNTLISGMTNNWELEINYEIVKTNNQFVEYNPGGINKYYIFDEDTSNLSDNDRYIVSPAFDLTSFTAGRIFGRLILGDNSNGSRAYFGPDIKLQFSVDGTDDTGMLDLATIVQAVNKTEYVIWKDFEVIFDIQDSSLDLSNVKLRIVQEGGSEKGKDAFAITGLGLVISEDSGAGPEDGAFRYNPAISAAEVYVGSEWIPASGVTEDPVTEEYMQELVGLYAIVLG